MVPKPVVGEASVPSSKLGMATSMMRMSVLYLRSEKLTRRVWQMTCHLELGQIGSRREDRVVHCEVQVDAFQQMEAVICRVRVEPLHARVDVVTHDKLG